jgi:hypothetical protein
MTTRGPAYRRSSVTMGPQPNMNGIAGKSVRAPTSTRPKTTSPGSSSLTATLMNMKDEPQIAARTISIPR